MLDQNGYDKINNSVHKWLDEVEENENRKNSVFGLQPRFYLIAFVAFWFFFSYKSSNSIKDENISTNPVAENYKLYEKPNNASGVILSDNSATSVKIIDETKYFYKVELTKDGKDYNGYINKENVTK